MNRFFGAILLVSGMAIGTGMLALPVITSFAGFFPSLFIMLCCWFFILMTGFIIVDVSLAFEKETNFISMAERTLGSFAKKISWVVYLLLFYAVNAAHILGSIPLFSFFLPFWASSLALVALCIGFVYYGTRATDILNRFVIFGLFISYGILISLLPSHIVLDRILHVDFKPILFTIPVLLISFGYQNIVPSLVTYLKRDGKKTKWALGIGTLLPLLIYAFWQFLVIGSVPLEGKISLAHAYFKGEPATIPLMNLFPTPLLTLGSSGFTLFTLLASYIGISLGLVDFLIDGLKLKTHRYKRAIGCLLAFFPPLFFVYLYPEGFFRALQYAGILAALFVGLLPTLMAWKLPVFSFWKTKKGKGLLLVVFLFFLSVILLDILFKTMDFSFLLERYHSQ
jgi:tyrosine-specific transport protein